MKRNACPRALRVAVLAVVWCGPAPALAAGATLATEAGSGGTRLVFEAPSGARITVAASASPIEGARLVDVTERGVLYAAWDEALPTGPDRRVSTSLDGGMTWSRPHSMRYTIPLRAGDLEPGVFSPPVPAELSQTGASGLHIVQFETVGLEAWRRALREAGAEILSYLPRHAHVVRMDASAAERVRAFPFVRAVEPYLPSYRIDPEIVREIVSAGRTEIEPRRYNVLTFTPGAEEKRRLAAEIEAAGGRVEVPTPSGYRLEATLSLEQILRVARSDRFAWIDRWSAPENDMDIVRQASGANAVESVAGFSGQGVRAEVMDAGIEQTHQDFDGILIHGPAPNVDSHGTSTYGIVFGNGNRDGDGQAQGTGHLPSREAGYFFDYSGLVDRYQRTAELVSSPYDCVFQSNSWGNALTRSYNSISFEMDDIIWLNDFVVFQSQSNTGNQDSRPQAWSKNIVSVGAVDHFNTLSLSDDCWCGTASTGPAEDGRIKPDLAFWYDAIYTTTTGNGYTTGFGGTSAATPVTAGIGGLIFQMWAANVLGNDPPGATVFEKRPHASTLKAMMINTAEPYAFSGAGADLARAKQGWGRASAQRFYDRRALLHVVDEERILEELDSHAYTAIVPSGQAELKVTLVYTDRAGTTSALLHRVNDVTLKVTDPEGTTHWWGNSGLESGNVSTPGGNPDTKNTVENVFLVDPAPGAWTIEVSADDLNQDVHAETPEVDQDYALVVYGASSLQFGCAVPPPPPTGLTATVPSENHVDLSWTGTPSARRYRVYRAADGCGGTFELVGEVDAAETSFTDVQASGGVTYAYVVRALEACESADGGCVSATATGPCLLPPAFGGVSSVTGNDAATCGATLTWAGATPACGGPVVYNVYRGGAPAFVPGAQNRVASCVSGTSWIDTRQLATNQTAWYVVRAEDLGGRGSATCNGAAESNLVAKSAPVRGPFDTLYVEGFEAGLGGWTPSLGTPPATRGGFVAGTPTPSTSGGLPAQPGSCAQGTQCLFTGVNNGSNPNNGDVDDGEVRAVSPAIDASAFATARFTARRWHFNEGSSSDSGDVFALDVSSDDGTSWTPLEQYGALASFGSWSAVTFDLQDFRPLTSQMRLRIRSADGTFVDDVVETALDDIAIAGNRVCASAQPGGPGVVSDGSLHVDREGEKLRLTWAPECGGGTGYGIYRGDLGAGYASVAALQGMCGVGGNSASIDPGGGSYFFLVAPNDGAVEGSLGVDGAGTPRPQPALACWPSTTPACQ